MAFDRIVAIQNHEVEGLEHFQRVLGELRSKLRLETDCKVKLHRYPFGNINKIHADDRGWIFLERFITMVKCAMLEPDKVTSPAE